MMSLAERNNGTYMQPPATTLLNCFGDDGKRTKYKLKNTPKNFKKAKAKL